MAEDILSALSTLAYEESTLNLRRAWPHTDGHLSPEYVTHDGQIVAGQWLADQEQLEQVMRETSKSLQGSASIALIPAAGTHVLLQFRGADRRLVGLASLLERPDARLIVHRPERRAV